MNLMLTPLNRTRRSVLLADIAIIWLLHCAVSYHISQQYCILPYFTTPLCFTIFHSTIVSSHISEHHYIIPKLTTQLYRPKFHSTTVSSNLTIPLHHPKFHNAAVSSIIWTTTTTASSQISQCHYVIPYFTTSLCYLIFHSISSQISQHHCIVPNLTTPLDHPKFRSATAVSSHIYSTTV